MTIHRLRDMCASLSMVMRKKDIASSRPEDDFARTTSKERSVGRQGALHQMKLGSSRPSPRSMQGIECTIYELGVA